MATSLNYGIPDDILEEYGIVILYNIILGTILYFIFIRELFDHYLNLSIQLNQMSSESLGLKNWTTEIEKVFLFSNNFYFSLFL